MAIKSGIKLKMTKGRIELAPEKALDFIVSMAVGMIQRRTSNGIDTHGKPFARYSASYRRFLGKIGEDTNVDLTITGGLLKDLGERRREVGKKDGKARAWIGPGTGTSHQINAPVRKRSAKTGKLGRTPKPRAVKSGKRSPPHNLIGKYLHFGTTNGVKARPWLGLAPADRKKINAQIVRLVLQVNSTTQSIAHTSSQS